eukprot:TRINITY_DN1738_c1_g1_i1.p1 TRINITY_DN1738_c1_g1~~TRINITY_DN1738_c1_g1_i1.p1  ORF type:complete len:305 (+),score=54.65 TRINITY_DN1738_c1_g1_i1:465-1379(+)
MPTLAMTTAPMPLSARNILFVRALSATASPTLSPKSPVAVYLVVLAHSIVLYNRDWRKVTERKLENPQTDPPLQLAYLLPAPSSTLGVQDYCVATIDAHSTFRTFQLLSLHPISAPVSLADTLSLAVDSHATAAIQHHSSFVLPLVNHGLAFIHPFHSHGSTSAAATDTPAAYGFRKELQEADFALQLAPLTLTALPPRPAATGFFKNLLRSDVDYDTVFQRKASPASAADSPRSAKAGRVEQSKAAMGEVKDQMRENLEKLDERGQKLSELEERTQMMRTEAASFSSRAKQLRESMDKKWYEF